MFVNKAQIIDSRFRHLLLIKLGLLAFAVSATTFSSEANAAAPTETSNKIEIVTVTARRVSEDPQKVPVAVTAFDQKQLDRLTIRKDTDLIIATPSLNVAYSYGQNDATYSIRGLSQGQFSGPSVTSYFSDIPLGSTSSIQASAGTPLYDLASVQVLRGPQGTLFGRATTGGAIVYSPEHPDLQNQNWAGFLTVSEGTVGTNIITGAVNIPVIDNELAVRVSGQLNQMSGFERVIGTNEPLATTNRASFRVGVEWQPTDWITSYTVFDTRIIADRTSPQITVGYDPNFSLFNLPPSLSAPGGAFVGPLVFGQICAADVAFGFSPSLAACEDQRLRLLGSYKPALAAETARVAPGGDAVRRVVQENAPYPYLESARNYSFINNSSVDLGDLGFSTVTLKNNIGYSMGDSQTCEYVGIPNHFIETCFGANSPYESISQYFPRTNVMYRTLTEEFQISGKYDNDLLVWLLGFYYSGTGTPPPQPNGIVGCSNLFRVFGGDFAPGFSFNCSGQVPVSGYSWERGLYANSVLDLSRWILSGLHLTLGIRTTTNESSSTVGNFTVQYPSGVGALTNVHTQAPLKSSGLGWNIALDEQVNDNLLVYVTSSRGYKPGGRNGIVGSEGAPNFTPIFLPETVTDIEFGAKSQFEYEGITGLLNVNLYRNWYTNIQEPLVNTVNGHIFGYTENVAAAILQGIEVETTIIPSDSWNISGNYSLNDNHFSHWFGADPLGKAGPGDPLCVPAHSTPTSCDIDLSGNPFPNSAKHQGRITLQYFVPIDPDAGRLSISLTEYVQSREWWTADAQRNVQFYGPTLGAANVTKWLSQPGYGLTNMRIDWDNICGTNLSAALWGNNLFNKTLSTGAFAQLNSLGIVGNWFAPPRTVGIELKYRFGE